jgi:prepilin-type N-terminal cleavage/methylation domain-containing protein
MLRSPRSRPGYTLLEILAATAIGVMLLSALYFAYELSLRETTTGRDLTAEASLSRAVIHRIGLDLQSTLGMLPPKSGQASTSSSTSTTSTSTTSTTTPTTDSAATTDPAATTDSAATTDPAATSAVATGANVPFQSGIVGTGPQLMVFTSRLPQYLAERNIAYDPTLLQPADITRVIYYLHSGGKGLCRQERPWTTAEGVWNAVDPDRSNEDGDLIAPEVVNVLFEYASGTGYVSSWDGSTSGTDGASCQGPPRAIRMTLTIEFSPPNAAANALPEQRQVVHVFPIRASVGPGMPSTTTDTTTDTTTTDGSTTTGTTGGNQP